MITTTSTTRLLPAVRFYNRHSGGYLLAFFHAPDDDQAVVRNQQAAMVHGGRGRLGIVIADRFPIAGVVVERERHRGRFGRLAVIPDSVEVVGIVATAGEIDSARSFFHWSRARRDAIARIAGMGWKSGPSDLRDVALLRIWKIAHPAFAGREVLGTDAAPVLVSAVHVNDGAANDGARMAEHGRTGNRCGLHPGIFIGVIDLDVADGVVLCG